MTSFLRNNLFSTFTLLLSLSSIAVALQYSRSSSGFPLGIGILLALLAAADLLCADRAEKAPSDRPMNTLRDELRGVLFVLASAPAFFVFTKLFDFEVATYLYLVLAMTLLGERRPVLIVATSIGVLLVVKVLFFVLLDVTRTPTWQFGL